MIKNKILILSFFIMAINTCLAITTVGDLSDANCDFDDLQLALDSGDGEIYVSRDFIIEGQFTIPENTRLIGGFDDCNDKTINTADNKTEIIGSETGSTLTINNGDENSQVFLSNLDIKNAQNGSGLSVSGFIGSVTLNNSIIQDNTGMFGAGIILIGSSISQTPQLIITNSIIQNNNAQAQGGGIYCNLSDIIIDSTSLIANNQVFGNNANGSGGGIYSNKCSLNIYAGNSDGESAGIIANKSTNRGAGIYATESFLNINGQQDSFVDPIYGDSSHPVLFKDNVSDSDQNANGFGAAMYLRLSQVEIKAAWFDGNKGSENGTGEFNRGSVFHADFQSTVTMTRDESQPCWRQGLCNLITNNLNVAIYAQRPGTEVSINDTEFYENTADFTGIIWVRNSCCLDSGFGPIFNFENNLVHHNNSTNSGFLKTDSDITNNCCEIEVNVLNNTITDNNFGNGNSVLNINSNVTLNLHNNIIYENMGINVLDSLEQVNFVETNISCLLVHEEASIPTMAATIFVANPFFVDPLTFDYHLLSDSPAIDVCGGNDYIPMRLDMDQESQDRDDILVDNIEGIYDLGVDEYYLPDLIFKNSFEI
ncbi:MAG: hypothetical protein AB8B80_14380 [Marinicellaceae bacterium]